MQVGLWCPCKVRSLPFREVMESVTPRPMTQSTVDACSVTAWRSGRLRDARPEKAQRGSLRTEAEKNVAEQLADIGDPSRGREERRGRIGKGRPRWAASGIASASVARCSGGT